MDERPPKYPLRFFRWFCNPDYVEDIEGDLLERFEKRTNENQAARWLFTLDVLRLFRPGIIRKFEGTKKLNYYGMFKNYFTTSIRFFRREKLYAFMNVSGLALGIACALVIFKIVDRELSYNKHHINYDQLYRVINQDTTIHGLQRWAGQVHPLAGALRNDFPGLNACMTFYDSDGLIGIVDKSGNIQRYQEQKGVAFVEPPFLELFTLRFLVGDHRTALDQPGKVILTKKMAKKYFGLNDKNLSKAIDRSIILENEKTVLVSAVIEDTPLASDFPFDLLFHYQDQDVANLWFNEGTDWDEYNSATNCFVLLQPGMDPEDLEAQLVNVVNKYLPEHTAAKRTYKLQPLSDLHSSSAIPENYSGATVSSDLVIAIGLLGFFLLITACINFVNLSTAQAVKRSKEVGVRKTLGSGRRQLINQFLLETLIIVLFAAFIGVLFAELLSKQIQAVLDYQIAVGTLLDFKTVTFIGVLIAFTTLISGIYPSLILARMKPMLAVKNSMNMIHGTKFLSLRRGLVVLQFAISQLLIIGTLVIRSQMDYFLNKDLGFNEESIMVVKIPERDSLKLQVLRNSLVENANIELVSFSTSGPLADWKVNNPIFHPNIEGDDHFGNLKNVDENYFNLYELEFLAGSGYTKTDPSDHAVVNRKLTRLLGFGDPAEAIGERVKYGRGPLEFTIIGVVEDFHSGPLQGEIDHVIFANLPWNIFQAGIKINIHDSRFEQLKQVVEHVDNQWSSVYPNHVFEFEFYNDQLTSLYNNERKISRLFQVTVLIAIIIGCLGLYGLVSFIANQKTKEIGIRKVMGASVWSILNIFSREIILLLSLAFLLSVPVAYYTLDSWLNNYAYRITITPMVFVAAVGVSLTIALVTISSKSIRAARANPVRALRDE